MSQERVEIVLEPGSHLTYLPEARVLFGQSNHHQETSIVFAQGSTVVLFDGFTLHDPSGQGALFRGLCSSIKVKCGNQLALLDRQHIVHPTSEMFRTYRAFGTILLLNLQAPAIQLSDISGLYASISGLPNQLGYALRLAATDLRPIREALHRVVRSECITSLDQLQCEANGVSA
jgi:urease accessory protein